MSKSGMLSSRSERIWNITKGVSDRVDSMLRSKNQSVLAMNAEFRKVVRGRQGIIDLRQLNLVLSKFGIQHHDDL